MIIYNVAIVRFGMCLARLRIDIWYLVHSFVYSHIFWLLFTKTWVVFCQRTRKDCCAIHYTSCHI